MLHVGWGHPATGKGFSLYSTLTFFFNHSHKYSIIWKTEVRYRKEKQLCFFFCLVRLSEIKVNCHVPIYPSELEASSVLCVPLLEEGGNVYSGAELKLSADETPAIHSILLSCVLVVGYCCQMFCNLERPLYRVCSIHLWLSQFLQKYNQILVLNLNGVWKIYSGL